MNKEIREKKLQNKRLKFSKIQKNNKMNYSQNRFMTKYSDNFSKSPLRTSTNRGGIFKTPNRNNILLQRMKSDAKNKTPYLLNQKRKVTVDDLVIKSPVSFKGIQLNSLNKENKNVSNILRPKFNPKANKSNDKSLNKFPYKTIVETSLKFKRNENYNSKFQTLNHSRCNTTISTNLSSNRTKQIKRKN